MSKLNMNKKEWLDLVFEGKNKEYGAYKMRQEESKTTTKAFFSAIAIISGIALLPLVLSSFSEKPKVIEPVTIYCPITPVNLESKKADPKKLEVPLKKNISKIPKVNGEPKVVKKEETPKTEVPVTKPTDNGTVIDNSYTGKVTGPVNPVIGGGDPETIPEIPSNNPFPTAILDRNPSFPGGIEEFVKTVGKKFVTPEIEEEKTIKILVYFVVERDGSISNITVPRNPGFDLDKEAIRVLKSIKIKWEPGIYKGQPVRTSYSLPILIKMQ